jgi:hypothetical protein
MDQYPAIGRNRLSQALPQPIALTLAQTRQVAGGGLQWHYLHPSTYTPRIGPVAGSRIPGPIHVAEPTPVPWLPVANPEPVPW